MTQMYADIIAAVAGILVSILVDLIPKLNEWFAALSKTTKRGVMALVMFVVAAAIYGLSCAGVLNSISPALQLECNQQGIFMLIQAFVVAIGANQLTYWGKPKQVDDK